MANKMTYVDALVIAIEAVGAGECAEKLAALKEQMEKRGSSKTPTKNQKANEGVMDTIAEVLADADSALTVTELIAHDSLHEFTNQKISALLRKMVEAGRVVKTMEGKKAKFSIA